MVKPHLTLCRADRLAKAAQELSAATGRKCIPAQADVRQPNTLQEAVKRTIEEFGRIDFVICGQRFRLSVSYARSFSWTGAAGNFLAPISGLSENAFRTVIEIDTVCLH